MVQEISHVNSQNKYIILNYQSSEGKRELNAQADMKTKNGKKLKVKVLVDSIQMKPIKFSFKVFNTDGMKNGELTRVAPLEIEINGHKEQLEAAVTDLNRIVMFLGHGWLVKHNPEINWKNGTIRFTRCPGQCTMKHKDIRFKTKRTKTTDTMEQDSSKIGMKPDKTNPEDLPEYI